MASHKEYPSGGAELMKIGQIWIIESLAEDDRHTGIAVRDHLLDMFSAQHKSPAVTYQAVSSTAELMACLDELLANVEGTRRWPILDIETHGLDDFSGLSLKDGSVVSWDSLKPKLQAINRASRFNLFLVMACCNGGYLGQMARLGEFSAVCAYLGPKANLSGPTLLEGLKVFYTALFSGMDAGAALEAVNMEVPDFPYFFTTAKGLFRMGAEGYLRDETTNKRLRERAERQISLMRMSHHPNPPSIKSFVQTLKDNEKPYFENCIRTYFALDEFPENASRFPVTYWELYRAAHRR